MIKSLIVLAVAFAVIVATAPLLAQTTPIPINTFLPFIIEVEPPVAQATATQEPPTATATQEPTAIPATATPQPTATSAPAAVCSCSGNTLNCSDFDTQDDAQACFDHCRAQGRGDIHKLDRDNNGVACESLPVWIVSIIQK